MLGCCEAGFIPGSLTMIASWYKRDEMAFRNSALFLGREVANAVAGLFAFGILRLAGTDGLAGWRWLFISTHFPSLKLVGFHSCTSTAVEGILAVAVAFVLLSFLPDSPARPTSLLFRRLHFFTERERYILITRVSSDDPEKLRGHVPISRRDVVETITNLRIYPHLLISIALNASTTPLTTYGPLLIKVSRFLAFILTLPSRLTLGKKGLGFTKLKANAMSSVGPWISVLFVPFFGWLRYVFLFPSHHLQIPSHPP